MDILRIPQLVYSTRAKQPEYGTEFNRQVIAWTPNVSESDRSEFSAHADLTYTIDQQRHLAPVLAFSRLDTDRWLFCRAKSVGLYRKSSHHMLVHGVILHRDNLELIQSNPFLLLDPEVTSETGFAFLNDHPGDIRELPPLEVNAMALGHLAPALNQRRLSQLASSEDLEALDRSFPQLFDPILERRPVVFIDDAPPDPRRMEWCLLHFHPDDRLELSFHTWYGYSRRHDYRLLMVPQSELSRLRPHFQDFVTWPPAEPLPKESSRLAQLTLEVWRRDSASFSTTLERSRVTHLAKGPYPPLPHPVAELCLGAHLGAQLTGEQEAILRKLSRRSGNLLVFHLFELAEAWTRGVEEFDHHLQRLVDATGWTLEPQLATEALRYIDAGDWATRWAFLALLQSELRSNDEDRSEQLVSFWRHLVPFDQFEQFLSFLDTDPSAVAAVIPRLRQVVLEDAQYRLAGQRTDAAYWPTFLRWLSNRGHSPVDDAATVESLVDKAVKGGLAPDLASHWYQSLGDVVKNAGFTLFGYRILFQKWVAQADDAEERRWRRRRLLHELLNGNGSDDRVLRSPLSQADSATELWADLGVWMRRCEDTEWTWNRWLRLMESQGSILSLELVSGCGVFLAHLAQSSQSIRLSVACENLLRHLEPGTPSLAFVQKLLMAAMAEMDTMSQGPPRAAVSRNTVTSWSALIQTRLEHLTVAENVDRVDAKLMKLVFTNLVRFEETVARVREGRMPEDLIPSHEEPMFLFQPSLERLLRRFQDQRRLSQVMPSDQSWPRFLFDQLLRFPPPQDPTEDARYSACVELAWRCWARNRAKNRAQRRTKNQPDVGEMLIRRLVAWSARIDPKSLGWHLDRMLVAVPEQLHDEAKRYLPSEP